MYVSVLVSRLLVLVSHFYSTSLTVMLKSARSANSAVNSWPHTVCRRPRCPHHFSRVRT